MDISTIHEKVDPKTITIFLDVISGKETVSVTQIGNSEWCAKGLRA
jgi:hypothetical protein